MRRFPRRRRRAFDLFEEVEYFCFKCFLLVTFLWALWELLKYKLR
jgi:hypothetical protein